MTSSIFSRRIFLTLLVSLATACAFAQDKPAASQFEPEVGQAG